VHQAARSDGVTVPPGPFAYGDESFRGSRRTGPQSRYPDRQRPIFECLLSYRNATREAREFQFHPQSAGVEFALTDTKTLVAIRDVWQIVAAAAFQRQYGDIWIFGQPARYHRTGEARTTDDEVVMWPWFRGKSRLIHVYPLGEICRVGTWFKARSTI
jgi:hypothetical protein